MLKLYTSWLDVMIARRVPATAIRRHYCYRLLMAEAERACEAREGVTG